MKKISKYKIIISSLFASFLGIIPIVAAACSATANPQVETKYTTATTSNGSVDLGKVTIRVIENRDRSHEIVFANQRTLLDNEYFTSGNLSYIELKDDNKRYDSEGKVIDSEGYVLDDSNNRISIWTKGTDENKLKNVNLGVIQNDLLRLISKNLTFDATSRNPNNFSLDNQTYNQAVYDADLLAKINKNAQIFNALNIVDSVYTYITSMTDELMKFVGANAFDKNILAFGIEDENNKLTNTQKEFLVGLTSGVGAGRKTYKLALYNIEYEWEFVNAIQDLSMDFPTFGQKAPSKELVDPKTRNIFVKLKNIHLQYGWFDSSNKEPGRFLEIDSDANTQEAIRQAKANQLAFLNTSLSSADLKNYPKDENNKVEIKNLFYDIPLKDIVINFAPSTIKTANVNQQATNLLHEIVKKQRNDNQELSEEEKKGLVIYDEYYSSALTKVSAFSILGKDLKEDLKLLAQKQNTNYVEDASIEDHKYYEHDRGLNGVYPYVFVGSQGSSNQITRDDFIKSRKFVEFIKSANQQKDVPTKTKEAKAAIIALTNKDVDISDVSSFDNLKANFTNYVFDIKEVSSVDILSRSNRWNDKNS